MKLILAFISIAEGLSSYHGSESPTRCALRSLHEVPLSESPTRLALRPPSKTCSRPSTTRITEAWPKAFPQRGFAEFRITNTTAVQGRTLHNDCYAVTRLREQSFALRPKAHTHQHDRSARFLQNLAQRLLSEAFSFASREALRASPMVPSQRLRLCSSIGFANAAQLCAASQQHKAVQRKAAARPFGPCSAFSTGLLRKPVQRAPFLVPPEGAPEMVRVVVRGKPPKGLAPHSLHAFAAASQQLQKRAKEHRWCCFAAAPPVRRRTGALSRERAPVLLSTKSASHFSCNEGRSGAGNKFPAPSLPCTILVPLQGAPESC